MLFKGEGIRFVSLTHVCAFSSCLLLARPNVWCWGDINELDLTVAHEDLTVREVDWWQTLTEQEDWFPWQSSVWCYGNCSKYVWPMPGLLRRSNFWARSNQGKAERGRLQRERALSDRMRVIAQKEPISLMLGGCGTEKSPPVSCQISEILGSPGPSSPRESHL